MKTLFFIYELGQVDELYNYLKRRPEEKHSSIIVACSLDIEKRLREVGIDFVSLSLYRVTFVDQLSNEDEIMKSLFADARWNELRYRDIYLPSIFLFMLRAYLQVVRYYGTLLGRVVDAYPDVLEIKVFDQAEVVTKTHGTLASRELHVVQDCAKRIGEIKGLKVTIVPPALVVASVRSQLRAGIFSAKRNIFGLGISLWNAAVSILIRPRSPRFLISDHWRNIESSIKFIGKGELIFLDRTEITQISLRLLLRYRMRFVHITDFLSSTDKKKIIEHSSKLKAIWEKMDGTAPRVCAWGKYSFDELLWNAISDIMNDLPRILSQIEGSYSLYKRLKPQVVHLRASVSKQTHFSILALVAKKVGIPSVELQHGVEYLGPGSWSREHEAEYIALYGEIIKKEMKALGYDDEKLVPVGSPRFDKNISLVEEYRKKKEYKSGKCTVLCIAPDIRAYEVYDTYSARDYFLSVAEALKSEMENVNIIIKLRPGPANENVLLMLIDEAFTGFTYRVSHNEPLTNTCKEADIAISCFSTALLEALQFDIPVILPSLHPVDEQINSFHFSTYEKAGVVTLVRTKDAFLQAVSVYINNPSELEAARIRVRKFMESNFHFDGKSSERYASLMKKLAELSRPI